jgi:putative aldouronate transport system permease protein
MRKIRVGESIFDIINHILMALLIIVMVYPFWYVFVISINNNNFQSWTTVYFWPKVPSMHAYNTIFLTSLFVNGYIITILRTLIGTILSVMINGMAAYVLSRKDLLGRNFFLKMLLVTLYFGGGLIPTFLLISALGMLDTFAVLIIPSLMGSWNIILMKAFFSQLPNELIESAKIDGANDLQIYFRIVISISKPIFAAITLFTAVGLWNDWFTGEMFITRQSLLPIQTVLRRVIFQMKVSELMNKMGDAIGSTRSGSNLESVKMAAIVVTVVPIICVYPFLQKYFAKGIMIGSIKG